MCPQISMSIPCSVMCFFFRTTGLVDQLVERITNPNPAANGVSDSETDDRDDDDLPPMLTVPGEEDESDAKDDVDIDEGDKDTGDDVGEAGSHQDHNEDRCKDKLSFNGDHSGKYNDIMNALVLD